MVRLAAFISAALPFFAGFVSGLIVEKRGAANAFLVGGPVDMTGGQGGTYPRVTKLNDGSLLGAYTAFSGGNNILTIVGSTDGASSWHSLGVASSRPSATSDLDNPFPYQMPNTNRILLAFRNHDKNSAGQYTFFRITICYSDDGGRTWAYLSTPASDPGPVNGNWEPFLRTAPDGHTIQLYYSREVASNNQDTLMRTSQDGLNWSTATTVSGNNENTRDGMTGVTTVNGASAMMVVESFPETGANFDTIVALTSGDGVNWNDNTRRVIYAPNQANAGAPQIANVGGTLVVSMMVDEDSPAPRHWIDNPEVKIITSKDGGNSWSSSLLVGGGGSFWSGIMAIDNSNFLVFYDQGGAKSQKMQIT